MNVRMVSIVKANKKVQDIRQSVFEYLFKETHDHDTKKDSRYLRNLKMSTKQTAKAINVLSQFPPKTRQIDKVFSRDVP